MAGDTWLSPDTCGVKLREFEAISRQMDRAAPALDELSHQMGAILNSAGVETGPAMKVGSIARWAESAASDIRRRLRLVHEMDRQHFTSGICTPDGTYFTMPDRYKDQLAAFDGRTAADLLQKAAKGDRDALNELASFGDRARNPHFAKALLEALGPDGVVTLPAGLARQLRQDMDVNDRHEYLSKDAESAKTVMRMLCQSLAVGTDPARAVHVDDTYLKRLTAAGRGLHTVPGGGTVRGYQSMGTILNAFSGSPPLSVHFLETVGRDMIAYDRELYAGWRGKPVAKDLGKPTPIDGLGGWAPLGDLTQHYNLGALLNPRPQLPTVPYGGRTDVLQPLLVAAAANTKGAQALLGYTPSGQKNSYLEYLLHERRSVWARTDHGAGLGQAMQVAMSGHDETSQKLFKEMSELLGRDVRQFYSYDKDHKLKFNDVHGQADDLAGMRYSLGQIMRSHLEDIDNSLAADNMTLRGLLHPRDIDALLVEVAQDDQVFAALARDQIGRTRVQIDQQYATGKGIDTLLISEGTVFGHLLAMRREALVARGVKVDAANEQMKNYIGQGVGLIPVPYAELFGGVSKGVYEQIVTSQYGKVGDWLVKQAEQGGGSVEQDAKTASDQQAVMRLLQQMSLSVSVEHVKQAGGKANGESFATDKGKILPLREWENDPEKVDDFIRWCKRSNFSAPQISQSLQAAIKDSHDNAVDSFNGAEPGDLTQ